MWISRRLLRCQPVLQTHLLRFQRLDFSNPFVQQNLSSIVAAVSDSRLHKELLLDVEETKSFRNLRLRFPGHTHHHHTLAHWGPARSMFPIRYVPKTDDVIHLPGNRHHAGRCPASSHSSQSRPSRPWPRVTTVMFYIKYFIHCIISLFLFDSIMAKNALVFYHITKSSSLFFFFKFVPFFQCYCGLLIFSFCITFHISFLLA